MSARIVKIGHDTYLRARRAARRDDDLDLDENAWSNLHPGKRREVMAILEREAAAIQEQEGYGDWGSWGIGTRGIWDSVGESGGWGKLGAWKWENW